MQGQGESNPRFLRMDIVTEGRCLLKNNDNLKGKSILMVLTTTNPCGNPLLNCSAKRSGHVNRKAPNAKNNKRRGIPRYLLPPSFAGHLNVRGKGQDAQRLIRVLAEAKVDECGNTEEEVEEEGREAAGGWLLSCCLDHTLPLRTRAHFCRPGSSLCPQQKISQKGARGRRAR